MLQLDLLDRLHRLLSLTDEEARIYSGFAEQENMKVILEQGVGMKRKDFETIYPRLIAGLRGAK